jgi:hypothetical protein
MSAHITEIIEEVDVKNEISDEEISESECSNDEISVTSGDDAASKHIINHMYELFTNSQGINVTESLISIQETLEKTNKILYKILHVLNQKSSS